MIGEEAAKLLWDAHGAAQQTARFVAGLPTMAAIFRKHHGAEKLS